MKKAGVILALALIISGAMDAQYVRQDSTLHGKKPFQPYNFWEHTSVGGNFGLQFGDYTIIALSPLLNYHFNSNFMAGAGPIYQYYRIIDPGYNYTYIGSIYGGRVTALYYLPGRLSNVFVMGEYDVINVPYYDDVLNIDTRMNIGIPLAGGGYRQPIGGRMYFTVAGLWDLSGSPYSPYANPVILAGIDVGL